MQAVGQTEVELSSKNAGQTWQKLITSEQEKQCVEQLQGKKDGHQNDGSHLGAPLQAGEQHFGFLEKKGRGSGGHKKNWPNKMLSLPVGKVLARFMCNRKPQSHNSEQHQMNEDTDRFIAARPETKLNWDSVWMKLFDFVKRFHLTIFIN